MRHNFKYFFREGVKNMFSHGFMSFAAIGITPNSALYEGLVELDAQGYIVADETGRTSAPGVFAAGDIRVKGLRQIVTAAADGAIAAMEAERYLAARE